MTPTWRTLVAVLVGLAYLLGLGAMRLDADTTQALAGAGAGMVMALAGKAAVEAYQRGKG